MKEQEESDLEKNIRPHITVVDELPFRIADDDPFFGQKIGGGLQDPRRNSDPEFHYQKNDGKRLAHFHHLCIRFTSFSSNYRQSNTLY